MKKIQNINITEEDFAEKEENGENDSSLSQLIKNHENTCSNTINIL